MAQEERSDYWIPRLVGNMKTYFAGLAILVGSQIAHSAGDADAIAGLVRSLGGDDAVARFTAEEQLVKMGDDAVPALERAASVPGFAPARQYAINVLARIKSRRATQSLLTILKREPNVKARALICRHLGRLGVEEAVPIIGKWLLTMQGKPLRDWDRRGGGDPQVLTPAYAWIMHAEALRDIGSAEAVPILEEMLKKRHGGRTGRELTKAYQVNLAEIKEEVAFWQAVRRVPGLEKDVKLLFRFFRRDDLALVRLYREKVVRLGREGRWVLDSMQNHSDAELRQAAGALLREYDTLRP